VFSSIIAASSSDSLNSIIIEKYSPFNFGYIWMGFNCVSSATYILFMRKRIKSTNFKDFDTVYYNNMLSTPLLVFMSLIVEDWSYANLEKNFPIEVRGILISSMLFSGLSAFAISFASAWCIRVTSSTTYSMVGALNKLPIAASGIIFFGDPTTFGSVSAILIEKSSISNLKIARATSQPYSINRPSTISPKLKSSSSSPTTTNPSTKFFGSKKAQLSTPPTNSLTKKVVSPVISSKSSSTIKHR
ncbi:15805_t:CDS:2, partial [Entrophospora sp. SA101]